VNKPRRSYSANPNGQMRVVKTGRILYIYSRAFLWAADEKSFAQNVFFRYICHRQKGFFTAEKAEKPPCIDVQGVGFIRHKTEY
jgi:hypothetical protein